MLGFQLRKARKTAGMTQEQLAFKANLDRTYISQLENDKKSPTVDVLLRLCRAMGVSAAKILGKIEESERSSKI